MAGDELEYWLRLRRIGHPLGVRETQRILGLSSPGKAQRLLNRLVRMGLAERSGEGKYIIVRDPPLELVGKLVVAGRMLPRILVYAVYSTVLAAAYIVFAEPDVTVIVLTVLLIAPLWMEAVGEYMHIRRRTGKAG